MNKYFIRYQANTMFSIGHRKDHAKGIKQSGSFSLPQQEIVVYEILKPIVNGVAFVGLGFDGYIEGHNPDEALSRMFNSVNLILCVFSYVTRSAYNKVNLVDMYEANNTLAERKFSHYFYPTLSDEILKAIRAVDMKLFMTVWDKGKYEEVFTVNVLNSLYQLNKSLQEDMLSDEFLALWNGVEYLANTINKMYSISEEKQYIKCRQCNEDFTECPHCGHKFDEEVKTKGRFDGIRLLVKEKMNLSRKDFDKLHAARSVLLHDGIFKKEWHDYIPTVRNLLVWTIAKAIDLEDAVVEEIFKLTPKKDNMVSKENKLVHSSSIVGLDTLPSLTSIESQPTLNFEEEALPSDYSMEENGVITAKRNLNFKYNAPKGVKFNNIVGEIWLPKESGVLNANLEIGNTTPIKNS